MALSALSASWANEYRDRASRGEAFGRDADQVRMTWEAWHGEDKRKRVAHDAGRVAGG